MSFIGKWNIVEMEMWDEDYYNMEVQAHIKIDTNNHGSFQFGLVSGLIDGTIADYVGQDRFEFTFEGNDEFDPTSGSGWVMAKEKDIIEGEFRFHLGDNSTFLARKAK
ncbi:MAG: hypothetical protein P4L69_06805 [Desulfosporosinus sp.]|nr:hypothetical protein [Desulfosporosinus sp.]